MNINNKKGVVPAGILFAGGSTVGSAFFAMAVVLIAISQTAGVKQDFRAKKAVALCEEGYRGFTVSNCAEEVSKWDNNEILAYIKDDIEVPQYPMRERLGG